MQVVPDLFRGSVARFGANVEAVGADQWHLPTPCAEWDVGDLVNHLVSELRWIPPLLLGKTIAEVGSELEGDLLGDDADGAWADAATAARAAVDDEGAMERTTHLSYGDTLARDYIFEVFTDLTIHGWDLARAIGGDETIEPAVVELLYREMKPREEAMKASGYFGDRIEPPEDADLQTRLLAVFGRVA